jgi:hypothetical protein
MTNWGPTGILISPSLQKILTDANLCEVTVLKDINIFIAQIFEEMERNETTQTRIDADAHIVLERMECDGKPAQCGYYFVNHKARSLFWLEDFDIKHLLQDVRGARCPRHIS